MSDLDVIRDRLRGLDARRITLNEELMRCNDRRRANAIERELRAIRMVVRHYEAALKIETDRPR